MTGSTIPHNDNLDVLRGIAVLGVLYHHLLAHTRLSMPFLGHYGRLLGVQLFSLISGYLIIQSAQTSTVSAYLLRRVLRIFPVYWLAVMSWSIWYGKLNSGLLHQGWADFLVNLLALTHFVPAALFGFDVLTVSWTLSIELAWYALAPLIAYLARSWPSKGFWLALLLATLLVSSAWVWLAQGGKLDFLYAAALAQAGIVPISDFTIFAFVINALPAPLVFFSMGALLWRDSS